MEKKYSRSYLIKTGIGLQDVDHLKNSEYFHKLSERYIKGEITSSEFDKFLASYYENKRDDSNREEEADIVAKRIADLLEEDSFTFTVGQLLTIHKYLFDGLMYHPGKLRTYNFTKSEWVLDGASVIYGDYRDLEMTLQYDFSIEKKFDYSRLSIEEIIDHLSIFIANLWQIHVFEEGNTRTTAVFIIKYLRNLGFDVTNDTFENDAWYFRNALVRANYTNIQKGIFEDRSFLIKFLRNLLLGEKNKLENRDLHIYSIKTGLANEKESKIIQLMAYNPKIKTEEIASEIRVSLRTVKSIISTLEKAGYIERINGKRFGYWKVN